MIDLKPLHQEENSWNDRKYTSFLFSKEAFTDPKPLEQVQAVCFTKDGKVVLYKHIKGWVGLPGGHLDPDEDLAKALKRELDEEISCELVEFKLIAWEKYYWNDTPETIGFYARVAALVKVKDWTPDPDGKALERVICSFDEAKEILSYGDRGKILLDLAYKVYGKS